MYSKLRILLLLSEFPTWRAARHLSYSAQLGIEDGLVANGVQCLTVTSLWLPGVLKQLASKRFDQMWVVGRLDLFDEIVLERLSHVAAIRVGLVSESIEPTPEEWRISPTLKNRQQILKRRLQYFTHVLACDERDADHLNTTGRSLAMWWPQAVPARFVFEESDVPSRERAVFLGAAYGIRREWLRRPEIKEFLDYPTPPESRTIYPLLFNALHMPLRLPLRLVLPATEKRMHSYLDRLHHVRERCFQAWLAALRRYSAVVNLPHFVKTYAGRVVEGMAAGRPVISWDIPDRPRNRALFEEDRDILLYPGDDPHELVRQIKRVLIDVDLRNRLIRNARQKVRAFHTSEIRLRQILDWISDGRIPRYS